jgi:N4-gp56 family major capsid protein
MTAYPVVGTENTPAVIGGTASAMDATTEAVFIPVIYSKKAIVAREASLVFADNCWRELESEASYGSSVKVPPVTNFSTVTAKNTSTDAGTLYTTITETATTLTIGTWDYIGLALETFTEQQADRDLMALYAPKMGYALGKNLDTSLAAKVDDGDISQTVGTLIAELSYEDLLLASQYLDDANVPQDGRVIIVSPAQRAGFMKLDQFINGDYSRLNASASVAAKQGNIGSFMGYPVFVTTNVDGTNAAGHDNVMMHKSAFGLVVQKHITVHKQFDLDYFATKMTNEQIYGSAFMRTDHVVWLKGA